MSEIDDRVVILEFNNGQFESGVKESLSTLEKLKKSLNFEDSSKGLKELQATGQRFSLSNVVDNIQTVADRFSLLGVIGDQVMRRLTNSAFDFGKNLLLAIPNQIVSGGKRRAQNIEHAQFMMKGLLKDAYDWAVISEDLDYAVSGTAYGLDEAASAAAQLSASSVQFGDDMKAALRGISGTAAMTGESYDVIANIFTKIAGQGKIMTQELNQFAAHGINVAATLAEVMGTTEENIRALVHEGQIGFYDFAYAMDEAFGEHAKRANETFSGAFANVKASLSRMGAQFATPTYENLRRVFVALIPVLKDVEKAIKPISAAYTELAELVSGSVAESLENLHGQLTGEWPVETVAEMMWDDLKALNQISNDRRKQEKSTFSEIYNDIRKAADDYKKDVENLHDIQERIKNDVREDKKHVGIMTDEMSDALTAESPEEYMKNFNEAVDNNLLKVMKLAKTYSRRGDDMETVSLQVANAIGYITNQAEHLNDDFLELGNSEERSAVKFDGLMDSANESMEEVKDTYRDISLMSAFNGANPFEKVMQPLLNYDAALEQNMKNYEARMEELRSTVDDYTFAEISGFQYMPTNLDVLADIGEKGYTEIAKIEKDLIDQGYDYRDVQKAKQEVLVPYNNLLMDTAASLGVQNEEETKEQKIARKKKEMYDKMSKTVSKFGSGLIKAIGLEQTEEGLTSENYKNSEKYKQIIDDIMMGKYKNAPERWELLKKETGLWTIWQNGVNEAMGCEKRHQVSLEDEAALMKYLGVQTEAEAKQQEVVNGVFKKLTSILAGVASAFNIIKTVGGALWKEIVQPFLAWGVPRVLNAILTPLSWIGERLTHLWATIDAMGEGALGNIFADFREDVAAFWASVQELEGVKLLSEVWENFKTTLGEIADGAITKIMDAFTAFGESLDEGDSEFLLTIIDGLATGLATLIGWLTDGVVAVADFFSPFFDWLLMLPVTLQAFWAEVGGFEGLQAFFKPLIDWFNSVIDTVQDFWKALFGGENKETGEQVEGFFTPVITWFENLQTRIDNFITQAKQFTNIKDLFDWFISKVQNKIKNFWDSIWGKKDGEETADGAFTIGNAFEWLKGKISAFMDMFEPLKAAKQWLKDFWRTLFGGKDAETGEEVGGYLSPVVDWFNGVIESVKDFWRVLFGGENKETGEQVEGFFSPIITWFTNLQTRFDNFIAQAKQFTNIKDLFDWFIGKVQAKISNFWNSLWGKKDGEEAAEGAFTIGGAFEWLKGKISTFMDSIAPLKAIKDWFAGIFNEQLVKDIEAIGAAISEFFNTLFGKKEGEEAEENLGSFSERFLTGAETLGSKLVEIFGGSSSLTKLLTGGGIGVGLLTLFKVMGLFNKSKNTEGIEGVIFGSSRKFLTVPKIIAAILGLGTALSIFGKSTDEAGESAKVTGNIFVDAWNSIKANVSSIMEYLKSKNIFGSIYELIFGSDDNNENKKQNKGLLQMAKDSIMWVYNQIAGFISSLTGGKEGAGMGKALSIIGGGGLLLTILFIVQSIAKVVMILGKLRFGAAGVMADMRMALKAWQTDLYSDVILKIAYAVAIFAASIIALSFVPADKLDQATTAVTQVLILLVLWASITAAVNSVAAANPALGAAAAAINTFVLALGRAFRMALTLVGIGLVFAGIAAAIGTIARAMEILINAGDDSKVGRAVTIIYEIMAALAVFAAIISMMAKKLSSVGVAGYGVLFIGLAVMLSSFVRALEKLQDIKIDGGKIAAVVLSLMGLMVAMAALSKAGGMSGLSTLGLVFALMSISVGLMAFAAACEMLSKVRWGGIIKGLFGIIAVVGSFVVMSLLLSGVEFKAMGAAMAGFAAGVLMLSAALILLGTYADVALQGVVGLIGVMFLLLVFLGVLKALQLAPVLAGIGLGLLGLGAGAVLAAVALPLLAYSIAEIGNVWEQYGAKFAKGLITAVPLLLIFAVAAGIAGKEALKLGKGFLYFAIALTLIVGLFTGFKSLKEALVGFGEALGGVGTAMGGLFGKLTSKSKELGGAITGLSNTMKGAELTPEVKMDAALGSVDGLSDEARKKIDEEMAKLRTLDGSAYAVQLENVVGYIHSLNLSEEATKQAVEATVWGAVDMAQEDFTMAVYNLKTKVSTLFDDEEQREHFYGLLEETVNAGPIGKYGIKLRNLTSFVEGLNISDEAKTTIRTFIEKGALANAKYKLALKNIEATLSGYGIPLTTYQDIQDFIQGYADNQSFDVSLANIKTIIDENTTASMSLADKLKLEGMIQNAATLGANYNVTMASLKIYLDQEGIDIPPDQLAKVQTEIDSIGTMLANGVTEDEEGVSVETKINNLKIALGQFTYVHGEDSKTALNDLIDTVINKKKDYEIALNNVRLKLSVPTEENPDSLGWAEGAIDAIIEEIKVLAKGDPNNPYEAQLKKIWLSCSDYEMTPQSKLDLMQDISNSLEGALQTKFMVDSLGLALSESGLSGPTIENIKTQMEQLLNSGVTEADALYTQIVQYIRENVAPEEQGEAMGLIDQVINKSGNTTIAKLTQLGVIIEGDVDFASDTARNYWIERVQELLSIAKGEGGPIDLPVAIDRFLLDLEDSGLLESDRAIIERTANEILNAWDTYYNEGYLAIQKRQQDAKRKLLGSAYAYDEETGMTILGGTKLAKAWDEYWGNLEFDENDPAAVEKAWKGFSQYLYDNDISKEAFREALDGLDPVLQDEILDKVFPAAGMWGSDPIRLQEYFGGINEALRSGASDLHRFEMINEGRMDFTKLLFGDEKPDYSEVTKYTDDFYDGLREVMIEDANGNMVSIEDDIRREVGKKEDEALTPEEIIGYLFTQDVHHGYAREQLKQFGLAKAIIDRMEQELHWGEDEETGLEQWIEKLAEETPIVEKQFDAWTRNTYESLWNGAEDWQKEFLYNMWQVFNPKEIPMEDMPSYMEWLERVLDEWGITDQNGTKVTLQKVLTEASKGMEEGLANASPYDILFKYLSAAWSQQTVDNDEEFVGPPVPTKAGARVDISKIFEDYEGFQEFYSKWTPGSEDQLAADIHEKLYGPIEEAIEEGVDEETTKKYSAPTVNPVQSLLDKWGNEEIDDTTFKSSLESLGYAESDSILNAMDAGMSKEGILAMFSTKSGYMMEGLGNGVEGNAADYYKTFLTYTSENPYAGLADFWSMNSPSKRMETAGGYLMEGEAIGIEKAGHLVIEALLEVFNKCVDLFKDFESYWAEAGSELSNRYSEGVANSSYSIYSATEQAAEAGVEGARSKEYVAEELGQYFGEGYVRGIDSMRQAAYEAGGALASEAEQGNRDKSGTNSPSRVARSLGNFFGMGYVNGMMEFSKKVHDTAGDLATTAINTLRNPMQLVQSLLDSDLESDPTITPVMDLSQIQNGVRRINGMMPDTGINLGYISSSMNRVKTTNEDVVAAISGLSRQMNSAGGNVYNVNGVTYDDGTNIATAVQDLVRAARVERRR